MENVLELIRRLQEQVEAQQEQISALNMRIKRLEGGGRAKELILGHDTVDVQYLGEKRFKLIRFEAGLIAFSRVSVPVRYITVWLDEKTPPQFTYIGLSPDAFEQVDQGRCYLFNTAGKVRIPGQTWDDFQGEFRQQVCSGSKFCFQVGKECYLTIDDGRRVFLFSKDGLETWNVVVGLFGEGSVVVEVEE